MALQPQPLPEDLTGHPTAAPEQHRSRLDEEMERDLRRNVIGSIFKGSNQFDGKQQPFQTWWRSFKSLLQNYNIPPHLWKGIIMAALTGEAKAYADQHIWVTPSVTWQEFVEQMEVSAFAFKIDPGTVRYFLENLKQGDSSIDEYLEAHQILSAYVNDETGDTQRYTLMRNLHPFYILKLANLPDAGDNLTMGQLRTLLKRWETTALQLRTHNMEAGLSTDDLPPVPLSAKPRKGKDYQSPAAVISRLIEEHRQDLKKKQWGKKQHQQQQQQQKGDKATTQGGRGGHQGSAQGGRGGYQGRGSKSPGRGGQGSAQNPQSGKEQQQGKKWQNLDRFANAVCRDCGEKGHNSASYYKCTKHEEWKKDNPSEGGGRGRGRDAGGRGGGNPKKRDRHVTSHSSQA